jgi:hypothetical protein
MGHQFMSSRPRLGSTVAAIDACLARLGPGSNGVVSWVGSDPYKIRREGDALVAVIANPRLAFRSKQFGHLSC